MIQNHSINSNCCNLLSCSNLIKGCLLKESAHTAVQFREVRLFRESWKKEILGINLNQMLLERKETNHPGADYVISSVCHSQSRLHYLQKTCGVNLTQKHSSFILQYPEKLPSHIHQMPVLLLFLLRHALPN